MTYSLQLLIGRCKSAFHLFLENIMDDVEKKMYQDFGVKGNSLLSSCTWEKFGERMAHEGGRQLGLFDELLSFFATMNMYSNQKCQVSESKEGSDFLQMYTGKAKSRETGEVQCHVNVQI